MAYILSLSLTGCVLLDEKLFFSCQSERDVSVRQRAADLLYAMCDRTNAQAIVSEMLAYLETADYSIREEMVLKVAVLAEKYALDYTWYVDTILQLIRVAGDYVSDEVWHRVVQIVVNREDVQGYAAKTVFEVSCSRPHFAQSKSFAHFAQFYRSLITFSCLCEEIHFTNAAISQFSCPHHLCIQASCLHHLLGYFSLVGYSFACCALFCTYFS